MGIFNSYVKLPEGTKHLEQWHDQTPHISPPWHGSFPSRVNPYQTILPLVAAWNLHFPPEELLASFGYIDTSSVLVSTSLNHISGSTIWRYIKIDDTIYLNHIIIYLHMLPVTIFTPYLFGGSTPHPALEPGWKGREICAPNEAEKSGAGPDWNLIPGDSTDIPVRYIFPVIEIR